MDDLRDKFNVFFLRHRLLQHHPVDVFEVRLLFRQGEVLLGRHAHAVVLRLPLRSGRGLDARLLRLANGHAPSIANAAVLAGGGVGC